MSIAAEFRRWDVDDVRETEGFVIDSCNKSVEDQREVNCGSGTAHMKDFIFCSGTPDYKNYNAKITALYIVPGPTYQGATETGCWFPSLCPPP